MKAESFVLHHWDDVVFENRNKAYGAYLLRRAYTRRLQTGLCITLALVVLLFYLPDILSHPGLPVAATPTRQGGHQLSDPPVFKKSESFMEIRHPQTSVKNRPILVTRDEVVEQPGRDVIRESVSDDTGGESVNEGVPGGTDSTPIAEPVAVVVPAFVDLAEVMPHYEGGVEAMMKFIQKKIRYPNGPKRIGIDGTVYVRFIVNGDGSISHVEVIKGVHPDYDKEAMRVISILPSWVGGSIHGMPVSVRMVLPIKFSLK